MDRLLDFYKGMDLSFVPQCLDAGMVLRDRDGTPLDALSLARAPRGDALKLRLRSARQARPCQSVMPAKSGANALPLR